MEVRGITSEEVEEAVETGSVVELVGNRVIHRKVFTDGYRWKLREYPHKEVTVVFVIESDQIVIITAIARYGFWENIS